MCTSGLVLWIANATAASADATPADKATAQALFDDAKALAAAGQFAQACPKFEESLRLDPGIGTQFNLANCYEQAGRTASAWTTFIEVAGAAREAKQPEREQVARERAAALENKLSRLTIAVVPKDLEGLEIKRDGVAVGKAQWGTALPLDPGAHLITASAPGKKAWQESFAVPTAGGVVTATVPDLADETPVPASPPPIEPRGLTSAERTRGDAQRAVGVLAVGAGVIGIATGGVLGLLAKAKYNTAADHCSDAGCDPTGVDIRDSAFARGNVATVVMGVGAALAVGGAVVWIAAPSPPSGARANLGSPSLGLSARGVTLRGVW